MGEVVGIGGREVEISSRQKVLFPESGITKGDLIDYYGRIADVMLLHLEGRPISMQRFPNGLGAPGFYQKEAPDYFPDWIDTVPVAVEEDGTVQPQVVVNHPATLVYLANQGTITLHAWLSRADRLDYPDKMVFDLDPPGDNFALVVEAARAVRALLDELDIPSFVKTTGSKGLHVAVPLDRSAGFDTVRAFTRRISTVLARRYPERFTDEIRKKKRGSRLFLDWLRNSYAQHAVAPYAVRARPGAPVAAPLDWDELSDAGLTSARYTVRNIFRRLGQKDDPWAAFHAQPVAVAAASRRLDALLAAQG